MTWKEPHKQKQQDRQDPQGQPLVPRLSITRQAALYATAPHRREGEYTNGYGPYKHVYYGFCYSLAQKISASLSKLAAHTNAAA